MAEMLKGCIGSVSIRARAAAVASPVAWPPMAAAAAAAGGRRRSGSVRCLRVDGLTASAVSAPPAAKSGGRSLAERLRLGSLAEDGLSYKESFVVRCYEVGINKTATVETIANLLQEVGCNHAQSVGFSTDGFATTTTMRKLHLIWVTARMHIEIYKYPAWGDVIEIETWCQGEGRIGTRRDWILKDFATGEVIGRATRRGVTGHYMAQLKEQSILFMIMVVPASVFMSCPMLADKAKMTGKWVMMNQDTRKLERVIDEVKEEYFVYCPSPPRYAFPEEDSDSLKKIPKLEDPAEHSQLGLVPRRADLDMNQHVNNVTYIGWVLESIPQVIIDTHELQTITLDYRRECQQNDMVDSLTSPESAEEGKKHVQPGSTNGSAAKKQHDQDHCQFLHFLRLSGTKLEINRGRTVWRKLVR